MSDAVTVSQLGAIERSIRGLGKDSVPAALYKQAMEQIALLQRNNAILTLNRDQFEEFAHKVNDRLGEVSDENRLLRSKIEELSAEKATIEKAWKEHYGKLIEDYNTLSRAHNKNLDEFNKLVDDFNRKVAEKNAIIDKYNALVLEKQKQASGDKKA